MEYVILEKFITLLRKIEQKMKNWIYCTENCIKNKLQHDILHLRCQRQVIKFNQIGHIKTGRIGNSLNSTQ